MSLHVLDSKKWTVQQALLAANERPDDESIFIVLVTSDGVWDSIIGGKAKTGDLLLAGEVLRRRAFQSMEDWYT